MKENPQTLVIQTPEHFEIRLELAGIGSRSYAYMIDRMIQVGVVLAPFFLFFVLLLIFPTMMLNLIEWFKRVTGNFAVWMAGIFLFVEGAIRIGYFMLFEYFWNGGTPGKRVAKIRVVRKDGHSLTFLDSMLRNILRFVDILGGVYPIGLIVMFIDRRYRRLGDITAGTLVIQDSSKQDVSFTQPRQVSSNNDPEIRKAAANMSPEDYNLLTRFLSRRGSLEHGHRVQLALNVYTKIMGKSVDRRKSSSEIEAELSAVEDMYRNTTRIL